MSTKPVHRVRVSLVTPCVPVTQCTVVLSMLWREVRVAPNREKHYFRSRSMRITLLVLAEKVMVVVHSPLFVSPLQMY